MPTSVTFLSGTHTVGGVQVLVSSPGSNLVFDFGVVRNPGIVRHAALFHEVLPSRPEQGVADYLRAGMAPLIEGLYDSDALPGRIATVTERLRAPGRLLEASPMADVSDSAAAVFISHLHEDHMELIRFLGAEVPVYCSADTAALHRALVRTGTLPPTRATLRGLADRPALVGELTLGAIPVDHDIPGASGLVVDTPDGRIAYTGDWRAHGMHPDLMDDFARRVGDVDLLLTEASTTGHDAATHRAQIGERDIGPWFADEIDRTPGTVYVALHGRNFDRHEGIRAATANAGRTLVVSPRMARSWIEAAAEGIDVVDTARAVAVWDVDEGRIDELPQNLRRIRPADVSSDPGAFVTELPTRLRPLLLDVGAGPGDTFVLLGGHPYGQADHSWPVLETWTRALGMRLSTASSHGHAFPDALAALVDAIKPRLVIPVHTNAPEAFPTVRSTVQTVHRGQSVTLDMRGAA